MTEQIANQNVLLLAEIANLSYRDALTGLQSNITTDAGFTHVAPSTPNYVEFVDDQGGASVYVHDGFNGQAFLSNDRNTLVIGLRGSDSFADWVQHLSSGGVVFNGSTHPQLASAREYVAQMMAQHPGANVVFSGHSAGAYLGTILGYEYPNATVVALSFDPAAGDHLPRAVTKLYRGETDVWVHLTYAQNGMEKSHSTTPEHPFLTPDGQFAPISQVTHAGERWAA